MALAMIYPEAKRTGRGVKSEARTASEAEGIKDTRLWQARSVLRHSRELAIAVRQGDTSLDAALATFERQEGAIRNQRIRMRTLCANHEDLADKVAAASLNWKRPRSWPGRTPMRRSSSAGR